MKLYLYSLLAGVLVGVIYAVIGVRSPAPPIIALIGLLGILIGEQGVDIVRALLAPATATTTTTVSSDASTHPPGKSHAP